MRLTMRPSPQPISNPRAPGIGQHGLADVAVAVQQVRFVGKILVEIVVADDFLDRLWRLVVVRLLHPRILVQVLAHRRSSGCPLGHT